MHRPSQVTSQGRFGLGQSRCIQGGKAHPKLALQTPGVFDRLGKDQVGLR